MHRDRYAVTMHQDDGVDAGRYLSFTVTFLVALATV